MSELNPVYMERFLEFDFLLVAMLCDASGLLCTKTDFVIWK